MPAYFDGAFKLGGMTGILWINLIPYITKKQTGLKQKAEKCHLLKCFVLKFVYH